jgi:type I restriction enzyme, S subunit
MRRAAQDHNQEWEIHLKPSDISGAPSVPEMRARPRKGPATVGAAWLTYYTYFADGDVLLAKITPCFENGKLGIARNLTNGIGFGSSEYIVFRPNNGLSSEYLYYFLSQSEFRAEGKRSMTGAVGHKRVSKEFIERCRIPLAPLAEQQRIVAILDEAFAGLATATTNAEKNLKNARELFDGYIESVFSSGGERWVNKTVAEVADHCLGKMLDKNKNRGQLKPYLRNLNVRWFEFDLSDVLEMRFEKGEKDRYSAIKGDVLICEGGYPGRRRFGRRSSRFISRRQSIAFASRRRA